MLERASLTLENYASSEIGPRFYTEKFLSGIAAQRNALYAKVGKTASSLIVVTTLLAFYDSIQGTTSVAGLTVTLPQAGAAALCVVIAMSLFALVTSLLDQILIDRYISALGQRLGMFSFELTLLNYTAQNIWITTITSRYFGLASGRGHNVVGSTIGLFFVLFMIAGLTYPLAVILSVALPILSNPENILEVSLIIFSICMLMFSCFLIVAFSVSYKFRPSGTSEPDNPYIPEDFLDHGHPKRRGLNEDENETSNADSND